MFVCFLLCVVTMTVAIGTTLAFYSGGGNLQNNLGTKDSSVYLEEKFSPEDDWLPGETKTKEVKFGNDGDGAQVIRFKVELQWLNKSNGEWNNIETSDPVEINWSDSFKDGDDWDDNFIADASSPGWYYYNKILEKGDETPVVMESVTFSPKLANAVIGDSKEDFSGTTYRIKVYMEGIDATSAIATQTWGKAFVKDSGDILTWSVAPPTP